MTTTSNTETGVQERLARLEAADDLRTLAHEYCHGLDKRDLDRFLAIWAPDGEWALGGDACPRGPEAIDATVREGIWPSFSETHHWTSNHVVDWSASSPRGTCDVSAVVRNSEGQWLLASATYIDTYIQIEGRWLISRREATTHFTRVLSDA